MVSHGNDEKPIISARRPNSGQCGDGRELGPAAVLRWIHFEQLFQPFSPMKRCCERFADLERTLRFYLMFISAVEGVAGFKLEHSFLSSVGMPAIQLASSSFV